MHVRELITMGPDKPVIPRQVASLLALINRENYNPIVVSEQNIWGRSMYIYYKKEQANFLGGGGGGGGKSIPALPMHTH